MEIVIILFPLVLLVGYNGESNLQQTATRPQNRQWPVERNIGFGVDATIIAVDLAIDPMNSDSYTVFVLDVKNSFSFTSWSRIKGTWTGPKN